MSSLEHYSDFLLVSALGEEQAAFTNCLLNTLDVTEIALNDLLVRRFQLPISAQVKPQVALCDLDGMGNVWAMDSTARLIDRFCPRFVVLYGISGGRRGLMKRGDVGYSRGIVYSSFFKIESETLAELLRRSWGRFANEEEHGRDDRWSTAEEFLSDLRSAGIDPDLLSTLAIDPRKLKPIDVQREFLGVARRISRGNEWRRLATKWFSDAKEPYEAVYGDLVNMGDDARPSQSSFEGDIPNAREAIIASGEAVVASEDFQLTVARLFTDRDPRTKQDERICMFEMESYGVALACLQKGIPLGVVKGISDLAGGDKAAQSKDKDKYRLAAIASASAFVATLIKDRQFIATVQAMPGPVGWSRRSCIWSTTGLDECLLIQEQPEKEVRYRRRPCTNLTSSPLANREVPRGTLYEDVAARDYSAYIESILKVGDAQIVLVYPYTTRDLLAFCANSGQQILREDIPVLEDLARRKRRSKEDTKHLARLALRLGKTARRAFPHFEAGDRACLRRIAAGISFAELAGRVCRVVFMRRDDQRVEFKNPAMLMHLGLCGFLVPTFLVDEDLAGDFYADEATYVRIAQTGESPEETSTTMTTCLKYADRSKLLMVLGRCDDLPDALERGRIFGLVKSIQDEIDRRRTGSLVPEEAGSRFRVFPAIGLTEKFKRTWKTLMPEVSIEEDEKKNLSKYIRRLRKLELEDHGSVEM